jgi:hypothetical protein
LNPVVHTVVGAAKERVETQFRWRPRGLVTAQGVQQIQEAIRALGEQEVEMISKVLKRFELVGTSKDEETDDAIRSVLGALPSFSEPPPAKMPQPIKLRIVAGGRY